MKYLPFLAVVFLAAFSFLSVSAQQRGIGNALSAQFSDGTNSNDSQIVNQYVRLSKSYLNINSDSSLYWADEAISFALLKNNWTYLQYGLQARKLAEETILNANDNKNIFLLTDLAQYKKRANIFIIVSIALFLFSLLFFLLLVQKEKKIKDMKIEKEHYEHRIEETESRLPEIHQKNTTLQKSLTDLNVSYDNLQKTNDIKDKLIPMIAHDIRSPLATLQNALTLTRENIITPEEFQKLSFSLEADVFNLRGMLDNMLLWAREQMLETKINKVKFNLSDVFKDIILMYRNNLVTKNITLHNYMPQHLEVTTDKEIMSAVFRNLFSNAVKFTETGKNIYISQIFLNNKAFISVKNEGKPIQPELLEKLNKKEHVSTRGTANEKGTGLGLLFCREMLTRLDESFDITSYSEQGTSVTFSVNMA